VRVADKLILALMLVGSVGGLIYYMRPIDPSSPDPDPDPETSPALVSEEGVRTTPTKPIDTQRFIDDPHVDSRRRISGWPPPPDAKAMHEALVLELRGLGAGQLELRLDELLASGSTRRAVLDAAGHWVKENDASRIKAFAEAMLRTSPGYETTTIFELMEVAESIQAQYGNSFLHAGILSLGMFTSLALEGTDRFDEDARNRVIDGAVMASRQAQDSFGSGAFAALLLGSAGDGHPLAIETLSQMALHASEPYVRDSALASLGKIGSPRDLVEKGGLSISSRPVDHTQALHETNGLTSLLDAAGRHPGESEIAATHVQRALEEWGKTDELKPFRNAVISKLGNRKLDSLRPTLESIAADARDPEAARLAGRVLDRWNSH
jgi:hypothetical protein